VDVSLLDAQFEEDDVIDLQALKDKGLVLESAKILKIYKSGSTDLTKSFTVIADHLTVDAIFAIHRANGNIQKINKSN
jgi:ribosomal protein L15